MSKIYPRSELYIKYTLQKLSNDTFYNYLVDKILDRLKDYLLTTNKKELLENLEKKLTAGALEHGEIPSDYAIIEGELEQEYLGLIGYTMIHFFNVNEKIAGEIKHTLGECGTILSREKGYTSCIECGKYCSIDEHGKQ